MMNTLRTVIFAACVVSFSACSMHHKQERPAECSCHPVTLKDLKPMVGTWHGKNSDGGKIEVTTREVSGGSAIEETLFPGTPHEMVSMYAAGPTGVQMTHYCMLENQPVLAAKRISENEFLFEFTGGANITPGKGRYMNEMRLTFVDDHHIKEVWSSVNDGKPGDSVTLDLWNCSSCQLKKGKAACKTGCPTHASSPKCKKCKNKK